MTRLQISGHRFLMRRMEHAVLSGTLDDDTGSVATPRLSFAVGGLLAALAIAACAIIPVLRPSSVPGTAPGHIGFSDSVLGPPQSRG